MSPKFLFESRLRIVQCRCGAILRNMIWASKALRAAVSAGVSPIHLVQILISRLLIQKRSRGVLERITAASAPLFMPVSKELRVGFFVHLFHEEYLERFFKLINTFESTQISADFFVTTSSEILANQISARVTALGINHQPTIVICRNRGRNFGPLLSEFAEFFDKYDYCIHLHSKKSKQLSRRRAESWAQTNWSFLGLNIDLLMTAIGFMEKDKNINLSFSWHSKSTPLSAFTWGLNISNGQKLASCFGSQIVSDVVIYPVGGMFLARGVFLASFAKSLDLSYDDFPEESGQIDGCLHHAVERTLGLAIEVLHQEILVFSETDHVYYLGSHLLTEMRAT